VRIAAEAGERGRGAVRTWWLCSREVSGPELSHAVQALPQRWHGIAEVNVAVALERSVAAPRDGFYSIYLPTEQRTGGALWVNGPFFGNIARTHVDFDVDDPGVATRAGSMSAASYNRLLRDACADLAVEMIDRLLSSDHGDASQAAIDLLDPRHLDSPMLARVRSRLEQSGRPVAKLPLVPLASGGTSTKDGARGVVGAIRLAGRDGGAIFTVERLARAGVMIPAERVWRTRADALKRIAGWLGVSLEPTPEELARWGESLASGLRAEQAPVETWAAFYEELRLIHQRLPYPRDREFRGALRTREVLLTEDGRLLASTSSHPRVFAPRARLGRRNEGADEVVVEDTASLNVPERVRPSLAFFTSAIPLHGPAAGQPLNAIGQFLRSDPNPLLRLFETREIVNRVLVPLAEANDSDDELHASLLAYAFELARETGDGRSDEIRWGRLRVPTATGWIAAEEAYFGPGWEIGRGEQLLAAFGDAHPVTAAMLAPPGAFSLRVCGDELVVPGSEAAWTAFLRDRAGVADAPRVRELLVRLQDQAATEPLRMRGRNYRLYPEVLANHFQLPAQLWKEYQAHIGETLKAEVKHWADYALERQATFDGLFDRPQERANAFAVLVAKSFDRWKEKLTARVLRVGVGWSSEVADSPLGFALKRYPWLPAERVTGAGTPERRLATPDDVWYIPADLSGARAGRRYGFLWHLPSEVAEAMPEALRKYLGLRAIREIGSLEHGIRLLAALSAAAEAEEVPPERDREFADLWRTTLAATAAFFGDSDADRVTELANDRHLGGVRVVEGGRQGWRALARADRESDASPLVYLPGGSHVDPILTDHLPVADLSTENREKQVAFLHAAFGEFVAPLSNVRLHPESGGTDLDEIVRHAEPLAQISPWLLRFVLAVFAFGRGQEMNPQRPDFRSRAARLGAIRMAEVPGLTLRAEGLAVRLDPPVSYVWAEHDALLFDPGRLRDLADLAAAFQTLLNVPDLEHPLHRALAALRVDGLGQLEPTWEAQLEALRHLRISQFQYDRLASALDESVDDRLIDLLVPALCAVHGITVAGDAAELARRFRTDAATGALDEVLPRWLNDAGYPDASALLLHARRSVSTRALSEELERVFGILLSRWNAAVAALGPPYGPVENAGAAEDFEIRRQELRPIVRAVLRDHARLAQDPAQYLSLKQDFEDVAPDPTWASAYWSLPEEAVAAHLVAWLIERGVEVADSVKDALSADSAEEARARARRSGLEIDHDDETWERENREALEALRSSLARHLAGYWIATRGDGGALPDAFVRFLGSELYTERVRGICQLTKCLPEAQAVRILLAFARDIGLLVEVDVIDPGWTSERDWESALPLGADAAREAAARLGEAGSAAERQRSTRTLLGGSYVLPEGEVFTGLDQHIDSRLPDDFGAAVSLTGTTRLGTPPPAGRGGEGKGPGRSPRISAKDKAFVGAVGEYLVYKVLVRELGAAEAAVAWKSWNRHHFGFPDPGRDELGYDFSYVQDGVAWMLEVKSSQGEPLFVDLTQKERDVAEEVATTKKRKYNVVYVMNALTQPRIITLGNPFTREGRKNLTVVSSGARISFSRP
jgi:Domain of unknown function (DUF3883)